MRLTIVAVGKARASPERDLYEHYAKRMVWPLKLVEVEERKRLPPAELKEAEGRLLLEAVPGRASIWALDVRGRELSSEALAQALGRKQDGGEADLALGFFPPAMSAIVAEGAESLLRHQRLYDTRYVCVMRRGHPLAGMPLTLDHYCAAHYLMVSFSGRAQGLVDQATSSG